MAKEARKHTLGVFHPTFSLLRSVRASLLEKLPADAHLRASGRLCVSLTRLADGKNVLVSEFDSRDELIQVLMCSCFFPVYCGFVPPSYRGVHYMDGALSNNMPLFEHRNTITMAPFSGESDICPREGTFNFFDFHYGNMSIQVNTGNVHRVCTSFLPPRLEKLAEICHNGYMDALRFLRERDLLGTQHVPPCLVAERDTVKPCCELVASAQAGESEKVLMNGQTSHQGDHWWLDLKVIENLPLNFRKVLCEACRDTHEVGKVLPLKAVTHVLSLVMLPVELIVLLMKSLLTSTTDLYRRTWSSGSKGPISSSSRSSNSDLRAQTGEDKNIKPLTSTSTPSETLHQENKSSLDLFSLTSTCAGPSNSTIHKKPLCGKVTVNHRSKSTHRS